jgi:hypothetical protein
MLIGYVSLAMADVPARLLISLSLSTSARVAALALRDEYCSTRIFRQPLAQRSNLSYVQKL